MALTVWAALTLALSLVAIILLSLKLHGAAYSWWWVAGAFMPLVVLLAALLHMAWTFSRVGH